VLLGLDVGDNGSSSGSGALSDGSDVAGDGSGMVLGGFGGSSFSLGTLEGSGFGSLDSRSVSLGPLDVVLAGNNLGGVSFLGGSPCGLHFGESSGGFSDSSGSGVDGSFVGGSGSITSLEAEFSVVAGGLPFGEGTGSFLAHSFLVGDSSDVHGFGSSGETLGLLHGGVESGSGFLGGRLSISGTEVLSDLEGAVSREDLLLADVLGSHLLSLLHVSGTIEERHSREASHDGCGLGSSNLLLSNNLLKGSMIRILFSQSARCVFVSRASSILFPSSKFALGIIKTDFVASILRLGSLSIPASVITSITEAFAYVLHSEFGSDASSEDGGDSEFHVECSLWFN